MREHYALPQAKSRKEAEQMEREDRALKELGQPLRWKTGENERASSRNMRLSEAAERMLEEVWTDNKDSKQSHRQLKHIVKLTRNPMLHAIDNDMVLSIRRSLKRGGRAKSTVNRYMAALRAVLNRAHTHWGVIDKVPVFETYSEKGNERDRVLTCDEYNKLRAWFFEKGDEQMANLLAVLWYTGARLSEPLKLTWMDVDFNMHTLAFKDTKGGNTRRIKMCAELEEVLLEMQTVSPSRPFTYVNTTVCHKMKAATKALGLDDAVTCHAIRHTVASRLTASGKMPAQAIAKWMGWSSLAMYDRYSHLAPDAIDAGAEVLALDNNTPATQVSGVKVGA
jgi:integrase